MRNKNERTFFMTPEKNNDRGEGKAEGKKKKTHEAPPSLSSVGQQAV